MDFYLGKDIVAKDLRPKFTIWRHTEINKDIKAARRRSRRAYRQYLKTGAIRDFNRSQKKITRWDFD
jgi:hypothetical protein